MNRLTIFAHYDRDNLVDEYVRYFLHSLKEVSSFIVFVTTSKLGQKEIARLEELCTTVIVRENVGYDFVSWQTGMNSIPNIDDFDEVVICNDSIYGPFYPLPPIFSAMSQRDCDFWGMTDSYEIAYHLQSYFLVFKKSVTGSRAFKEFWNSVQAEETKTEVIRKYEVRLTQLLLSAGSKACAYAPYSFSDIAVLKTKGVQALKRPSLALRALRRMLSQGEQGDYTKANPTHYFWKELMVKHKMPFLKVELLRDNPLGIDIAGWGEVIKGCSNYDVELIKRHLERVKRKQ